MSLNLVKLSQEKDLKYNKLGSSLQTAKNSLEFNNNTIDKSSTGYIILQNLFNNEQNFFKINEDSTFTSSFKNKKIFFYDKMCCLKCKNWKPCKTTIVSRALDLINKPELCDFKDIIDNLIFNLMNDSNELLIDDFLLLIDAIQNIINQVIEFENNYI